MKKEIGIYKDNAIMFCSKTHDMGKFKKEYSEFCFIFKKLTELQQKLMKEQQESVKVGGTENA